MHTSKSMSIYESCVMGFDVKGIHINCSFPNHQAWRTSIGPIVTVPSNARDKRLHTQGVTVLLRGQVRTLPRLPYG